MRPAAHFVHAMMSAKVLQRPASAYPRGTIGFPCSLPTRDAVSIRFSPDSLYPCIAAWRRQSGPGGPALF